MAGLLALGRCTPCSMQPDVKHLILQAKQVLF